MMDDDSSQDYLQRSRCGHEALAPVYVAHCEPQIRGADSHENATYCRGNEHSATCAHKVRARCSYRLPPTEFSYCFRDTQRSASLNRYLLIAGGGALGALARYLVGVFAAEHFRSRFPIGTFSINISACFMIGFILEYITRHTHMNPAWRYGFAIGFLGAYSTFSSFEWETWSEVTNGAYWMGLLYVGASIIIGLLAVGLGSATARSVS